MFYLDSCLLGHLENCGVLDHSLPNGGCIQASCDHQKPFKPRWIYPRKASPTTQVRSWRVRFLRWFWSLGFAVNAIVITTTTIQFPIFYSRPRFVFSPDWLDYSRSRPCSQPGLQYSKLSLTHTHTRTCFDPCEVLLLHTHDVLEEGKYNDETNFFVRLYLKGLMIFFFWMWIYGLCEKVMWFAFHLFWIVGFGTSWFRGNEWDTMEVLEVLWGTWLWPRNSYTYSVYYWRTRTWWWGFERFA